MSWLHINLGIWAVLGVVWALGVPLSRRTVQRESLTLRLAYLVPLVSATLLIFTHELSRLLPWLELRLVAGVTAAGVVGTALTAAGVGFAIWARLHLGRLWSRAITLKEGHRLIQSGPYALARHPIYTGFIFGLLGSAVVVGTLRAVMGLVIAVAAYLYKLSTEERLLADAFGEEHRDYRGRVRRLIPFVW